ncbi:MAG: nucleotide sugar dehydrogenase [Chloroflexota bacterium]|nr:MAG: nucleotide sugar dehydrogenase [Chloroflexota bacterium]
MTSAGSNEAALGRTKPVAARASSWSATNRPAIGSSLDGYQLATARRSIGWETIVDTVASGSPLAGRDHRPRSGPTAPRTGPRMPIVQRPSAGASLLGGSIVLPVNECHHDVPQQSVSPWTGEPGTAGVVAVVGAGKMGLPLAAQFAGHGWKVIAVDVQPAVVAAINEGRSHLGEEPGVAELVARSHAEGRLRATTDGATAARDADVVVLIVPVMLDAGHQPDYRYMDAAVDSIAGGLHDGSLVVFETTLPVGDTRGRYQPRLEAASGLHTETDLFVAFSPERLYSGAVLRNLSSYPKLVGGLGPASTERAARFYDSVLDAEIVAMSSAEAAEFSKLADTTYRDVNIALANEYAAYADRVGVDIREVIEAANSQPYSHIHQPGIGVGGHCIPVYPHFLLSRAPELTLVARSREVNDGQIQIALASVRDSLGGLDGAPVLVLGLTYRHGVNELAYSRALPLIEALAAAGARVSAFDPLMTDAEIRAVGAAPYAWGTTSDARAIVTQTGDPQWLSLDPAWFPDLALLVDGRNTLAGLTLPEHVRYRGIGVPRRG